MGSAPAFFTVVLEEVVKNDRTGGDYFLLEAR